ncbi:MAG: sporulation protein SpoIID, partial [Desulfitobacterium hafniense]
IPGDEPLFSFDLGELGVPSRLSELIERQKAMEARSGPRLSRILSTNQGIRDIPAAHDVFVFNGRGWGHGVGMSQWGAYHMAQRGYTYGEILAFYYQQTDLIKYYL